MFDFTFNNISGISKGIYATDRPQIPVPKKRIEYTPVKGRDGNLTVSDDCYDDIEIKVNFNFKSDPETIKRDLRAIKNFLFGSGELSFNDDPLFFYVVKNVVIEDVEVLNKRIGRFNAIFTCEPFEYAATGKKAVALNSGSIANIYSLHSKPIYIISGNGLCTLTVNGKTMRAQVGQQATIDTGRMIAYKSDTGVVNNTMVSGEYEDLYLHPGENTVSVTSGFSLSVIPNWRAL